MPALKDRKPDSRIFNLFVGPSGDGKKCAALSYQALGPIRYIDFDMRIDGALGAKEWLPFEGIDYESFPPKWDKMVYDRINEELDVLTNSIRAGQCKYKTLIIGSITGLAAALLNDSLKITSGGTDGGKAREISRNLGPLKIAAMENFRFINNAIQGVMSWLQSIPINVIVLAHTVPQWGKVDENDPYSDNKIIGHQLALSDTLGALVTSKFSNTWRFERKLTGAGNSVSIKYLVEFRGQLAKCTFSEFPNQHDITRKNFYQELQKFKEKETK